MSKARKNTSLVMFITQRDVAMVLERLPDRVKTRLGKVVLKSSAATRCLGYVTQGRRDIVLACRLPPRVSLRGYMYRGQRADDYGAPSRGQWPPWAIRRYLLFGVLLHELGHLQRVPRNAVGAKGGFASEGRLMSSHCTGVMCFGLEVWTPLTLSTIRRLRANSRSSRCGSLWARKLGGGSSIS